MTDTEPFALLVLLTAAVGLVAVLSNRLTERVKIPSPALVLVGAAVAVKVIPALHAPPQPVVERLVTVALVCILFDGGMHIGWSRFRSAAVPIAVAGVLGTFLTVAAARAARARRVRAGLVRLAAPGHGGRADRPGGRVLRAGPARGRRPQRRPSSRASRAPTTRSGSR